MATSDLGDLAARRASMTGPSQNYFVGVTKGVGNIMTVLNGLDEKNPDQLAIHECSPLGEFVFVLVQGNPKALFDLRSGHAWIDSEIFGAELEDALDAFYAQKVMKITQQFVLGEGDSWVNGFRWCVRSKVLGLNVWDFRLQRTYPGKFILFSEAPETMAPDVFSRLRAEFPMIELTVIAKPSALMKEFLNEAT